MSVGVVSSCCLALLATVLCGQELLKPGSWQRIAPNYQLNYSNTAAGISFYSYCGSPNCTRGRTGISQTVQVPKSGLYQFRLRGYGGTTGNFNTQFGVGSLTVSMWHSDWHVTRTLPLPSGSVTIWVTTDTSNLPVDFWHCAQPSLTPVLAPTVDQDVANAWDPNNVRVQLRTPGQILAGSLAVPSAPIKFPGLTHGLDLSPSSMVILGVSATGGVQVDLSSAARSFGQQTWPTVYLQAVSSTGFGTRSWL